MNRGKIASPAPSSPPSLPWWLPECTGGEAALVQEVIAANYLNDGEFTARFERQVAARLGCRHAVAVTSGTMAIFAALAGLEIGPGDEVIVPDLTFIATANAVSLTGAAPILVDIDPQTLTICPRAIERAVTGRTRAIVPVHISGRAADMDAVLDVARRFGLHVVEDAAEAFLSRWRGTCVGTLGIAGCFSFSPNKIVTTGQGGIVVTDDDHLHGRLRELKDQGRPARGSGGDDLHPSLGYNLKLTNLQAAVGLAQLEVVDQRLARLKQLYRQYERHLGEAAGLRLPGFRLEQGEAPLWIDAVVEDRDGLDRYLARHGCDCRRFWFPLHTQKPYRQQDDLFPHATSAAGRALWLPSAFQLEPGDAARVCRRITSYLGTAAPQEAA